MWTNRYTLPLVLLLSVFKDSCLWRAVASTSPRCTRSQFLRNVYKSCLATAVATTSTMISVRNAVSNDLSPPEIRESLAKSAAGLPGMGVPDIIYPRNFIGVWNVEEKITSYSPETMDLASFPLWHGLYDAFSTGRCLNYTAYFIPSDSGVVLDRASSGTSFASTVLLLKDQEIAASWNMRNPNLLSLSFKGIVTEIKVTKRAVENLQGNGEGVIGFSEFARIAVVGAKSGLQAGVPGIWGLRTLVRFRPTSPSSEDVDGLVRR